MRPFHHREIDFILRHSMNRFDLPTAIYSAARQARLRISWLTRLSWRMTSACRNMRRARRVSKSGSPGPAPTRRPCQLLLVLSDAQEEGLGSQSLVRVDKSAMWLKPDFRDLLYENCFRDSCGDEATKHPRSEDFDSFELIAEASTSSAILEVVTAVTVRLSAGL
jgi:hypothetical protein